MVVLFHNHCLSLKKNNDDFVVRRRADCFAIRQFVTYWYTSLFSRQFFKEQFSGFLCTR